MQESREPCDPNHDLGKTQVIPKDDFGVVGAAMFGQRRSACEALMPGIHEAKLNEARHVCL